MAPIFEPRSSVAHEARSRFDNSADRLSPWLRSAGALALLCGGALLFARLAAFGWAIATAAHYLSPDGVVSPLGRTQLGVLMFSGSVLCGFAGVILLLIAHPQRRAALDAAARWDALHLRGLKTPGAYPVLAGSAGLGVLVIGLSEVSGRAGSRVAFLFVKEGPFENATFILELAASLLCAAAALRWKAGHDKRSRAVPVLYGLCAIGLFLIGMEEINWGQTLLGFETPPAWAAINYQHETSLHNLLDKDALTTMTRCAAILFGFGVLTLTAWSVRAPGSIVGAVAPHWSLVPLAILIASGGVYLHPEVLELLLAVFFLFYSYRICMAARSSSQPRLRLARAEPVLDADSLWRSGLFEHTEDAIIIWEMDGEGVLYWNRAAEQLYGYSREQARGRITHDLLKTRLTDGIGQLEQKVARYGVWVGELQHTCRDGRTIFVDARLTLLAQRNGRWLVLEINRDVTDQKHTEAARAAAERQVSELRNVRTAPL